MTPQEIIKEIQKLPPTQQKIVKDSFENGENKPTMTEEEFMHMLHAEGVIGNVPQLSDYTDADDDFEPIDIEGRPTSEIIIEERG